MNRARPFGAGGYAPTAAGVFQAMNWEQIITGVICFVIGWFFPPPVQREKNEQINPFFPPQRRWNDPANRDKKKDDQP